MKRAHSFPGAHILSLLALVERWGVSAEILLEGLGLDVQGLSEPRTRVSVETTIELLTRARALTREPALGIHLGLAMRAPSYGYVGFATLTAKTLGEALELAVRFSQTVTTAVKLRLRQDTDRAELIVDEQTDFGAARDMVLLSTLIGIWKVGTAMTGAAWGTRVDLAIPDPGYSVTVVPDLPAIQFGQPVHRLLFDTEGLDLPYTMADPVATRIATELCQRELEFLGLGDRLEGRIRQMIARGCSSLEAAAAELHVSARTLKRRLAREGVSFRSLIEHERREQAMLLVGSPELSLSEIARRLGYANLGNFERAFRRWTARTPSEYRRESAAQRG